MPMNENVRSELQGEELTRGDDVAIPDYQSLMLPVLKLASDGTEHRMSDVVETLANELKLLCG
jgi:restriction system protein